jgi:hypothetical protein
MAWLKSKSHLNATWHGICIGLGATWLKSNLCDMCHDLGLGLEMQPNPSSKCHVACVF